MRTNVELNDRLVAEVMRRYRLRTKREAVDLALRRLVDEPLEPNEALALEGSLLVRYAPAAVADAFCASRLDGDHGLEYGTLPAGTDFSAIVERHTPAS